MSRYVPRVMQLDALILDSQFYSLVKNQIFHIFNSFKVGELTQKYGAELQLIIKLLIWQVSVHRKGATIGQTLLGIKYSCDKSTLKSLFLLEALVPYIYRKSLHFIPNPLKKVEKSLRYLEDVAKACEILNFFTFLMENRYASLVNRLLKLEMIPSQATLNPSVLYYGQLREMLWHQFADFLMVVLPIVNIHRIKRYLREWGFNNSTSSSPTDKGRDEEYLVLKCCFCNQDPVVPQGVDSCVFCYYCLKANKMAHSELHSSCQRHFST